MISERPNRRGSLSTSVTEVKCYSCHGKHMACGAYCIGGGDQDQARHSVCNQVTRFSSAGSLLASYADARLKPGKRDAGCVRDRQLNRLYLLQGDRRPCHVPHDVLTSAHATCEASLHDACGGGNGSGLVCPLVERFRLGRNRISVLVMVDWTRFF